MTHAAGKKSAVIARLPIFKRLLWLWSALLLIGAAVAVWQPYWGISLVWGFSVCLVPALLFAWLTSRVHGAAAIHHSISRFYWAESAKLILTAVLFAVVFTRSVTISVPVLLCAFVTAQMAQLLVAAVSVRQRKNWRRAS